MIIFILIHPRSISVTVFTVVNLSISDIKNADNVELSPFNGELVITSLEVKIFLESADVELNELVWMRSEASPIIVKGSLTNELFCIVVRGIYVVVTRIEAWVEVTCKYRYKFII